jgi:hypothetical protein
LLPLGMTLQCRLEGPLGRGCLPRQAQRVVEEGKTLLKEAKGLGRR